MLKGKILRDGAIYRVKTGSVLVDITDDVRALLAEKQAEHEQVLAELRAQQADVVERYNRIVSIVIGCEQPPDAGAARLTAAGLRGVEDSSSARNGERKFDD